jgi:hypothetical protein
MGRRCPSQKLYQGSTNPLHLTEQQCRRRKDICNEYEQESVQERTSRTLRTAEPKQAEEPGPPFL